MKKSQIISFITVSSIAGAVLVTGYIFSKNSTKSAVLQQSSSVQFAQQQDSQHPLSIEYMRKQQYPGSAVTIEQQLTNGPNYSQYITSYLSDGLKIYALLTIPFEQAPEDGFPVIIFNHGYIPPEQYRTNERYTSYIDAFAKNSYIVFKPDYRGHGTSEGEPTGAYYSPGYTIDVLNAVSTMKQYEKANPDKIGMWGHSLGGNITLRTMVTTKDIKAGVIWGGVVGSYEDLFTKWRRPNQPTWTPSNREQAARRPGRTAFIESYGQPDDSNPFWKSITPVLFVQDISGPVQIHHTKTDEVVPWEFSQRLNDELIAAQKPVEYFLYENGDHNLSQIFSLAMQRSVDFFDNYLKS